MNTSEINSIKKDKKNLLNNNQCLHFVKDYKKLIDGKISAIRHPKTHKIITNPLQIKYLYDNCIEKYNIKSTSKTANLSKITKLLKSSLNSKLQNNLTTIQLIDYEKHIVTLTDDIIHQIIYMPIETHSNNRQLIKSLFDVPISYEKGKEILKKYLNNPNNKKKDISEYRKYINNIRMMLPNFEPIIDSGNFYYYLLKKFDNKEKIMDFNDLCEKEFISAIFNDTRKLNMGKFKTNENYTKATHINFHKRLEQNKHYYFALYYISKLIMYCSRGEYSDMFYYMMNCRKMMKKLIYNEFTLIDPNLSISFSSSDDSKSSQDATMNTIYKKYGKQEYIKYILNNGTDPKTINDVEPYLGERWEDLSINKLKLVVKISNILNNTRYTYAFYAKSLYKDWTKSIRTKKPFINPITRIPFTPEDELKILNVLDRKYPNIIGIPKDYRQRSDIYYQDIETIRIDGLYFWRISVWFNIDSYNIDNYIKIISIYIIQNLDIFDDEEYVSCWPVILFNNIDTLKKENKILGKKLPFNLHPAFAKYYNSYITTTEQYLDFCKLINNSI